MDQHQNLILVDSDFRHRAVITHLLSGSGIHVEPFDGTAEITGAWPRTGVLFVHDAGDTVRELFDYMTEQACWLPLIAYSESPNTSAVVQAVFHGAVDYVEWPISEVQIRHAMMMAEQNFVAMGNAKLREAMARSRVRKLTRREREVLAGVANGLSNRLIGERLAISPRTVEIHRANMLTKIGANHTSEAIRIAVEASLLA